MDINILGSYLTTTRQAPLSGGITGVTPKALPEGALPLAASPGGTDTAFAGILDRLRDARAGENAASSGRKTPSAGIPEAEQEAPPALSGRKPVIDKSDKLYEQCEALETFLVKTLISGMRNTVQKSTLIDTGFAGQMYEDMLYDEYARDFTRNANFGLAELAYLELTGRRGKTPA